MVCILHGWSFDNNHSPEAKNGRIIVVWGLALLLIVFKKSDQFILCGVLNFTIGQSFLVAFVYARNLAWERLSLCAYIKDLFASTPLARSPWIILGDFNQVLSIVELYLLNLYPFSLHGLQQFQEFLEESNLFDLPSRGCFFTWTNRQPRNPIARKLDMVLMNEQCLEAFPDSTDVFDPPGCSDHAPIMVFLKVNQDIRNPPFKFFKFVTSH